MTPCARGCCWTAFDVCAQQRSCPCHWADLAPKQEPRTSDARTVRRPTEDEAIRRVMAARRRNPKRPRT